MQSTCANKKLPKNTWVWDLRLVRPVLLRKTIAIWPFMHPNLLQAYSKWPRPCLTYARVNGFSNSSIFTIFSAVLEWEDESAGYMQTNHQVWRGDFEPSTPRISPLWIINEMTFGPALSPVWIHSQYDSDTTTVTVPLPECCNWIMGLMSPKASCIEGLGLIAATFRGKDSVLVIQWIMRPLKPLVAL